MIAHGALIFALLGRPGDAERWAGGRRALSRPALPAGVLAGRRHRRRALWPTYGPTSAETASARCVSDAAEALAGLGPASPYRATMVHTEGLSYLLEGDLERADASLAHAYDLAASLRRRHP